MGKLGDLQFLTIFKVRCLLSQGSLFFNHYLTFIIGLNLNWNPPTRWQYPFLRNKINLLPDNHLWVSFKRKECNCRLLQCSGVLASKGPSLQIMLLNCSNMKLSRACIAAVLKEGRHAGSHTVNLNNISDTDMPPIWLKGRAQKEMIITCDHMKNMTSCDNIITIDHVIVWPHVVKLSPCDQCDHWSYCGLQLANMELKAQVWEYHVASKW